jgi:hypothetical protein
VGARQTPESTPRSTPQPTTVAVKPAPPPLPPRDPEQVKREQEVRAFVIDCREVGLNAKSRDRSRELKEAWRKKNDQIASAVEKDPTLYTPALKEERSRLRGRLLQLDRAATDMAAPLAVTPGPARWNLPLVEALKKSAPKWDDALANLTDLAVRGDAKFDTAFEYMIHLDQEWRASAARFVADANRADQLLADGRTTASASRWRTSWGRSTWSRRRPSPARSACSRPPGISRWASAWRRGSRPARTSPASRSTRTCGSPRTCWPPPATACGTRRPTG